MNFSEINLVKVGRTIKKDDILVIEEIIKANKMAEEWNMIGKGCFGKVYKYTSSNGKEYAIKISKKKYQGAIVQDAHDIETLLELRGHKYIPKIHAYDNKNLGDCFVMIVDYIDGVNLDSFYNNIELNKNFIFVFQDTLRFIKEKGICLNDLHGNNIRINSDGYPIIIDFGGLYKTEDQSDLNYETSEYSTGSSAIRRVENTYRYFEREKTRKLLTTVK